MKHRDDLANGSGPPDEDMERLLDEVAAVETREREEADRLKDAPGLPRVERVLEEVWASSAAPARRRWFGPILLAAVAAAVIGFFFVRGRVETDTEGPTTDYLGDGEIVLRVPAEVVDAWPSTIEWSGPGEAAYTVIVRDASTGEVLHAPPSILGTKLALELEETRTWPKRIRIELRTTEEDGQALFKAFERALAR